MKFNEIISKVIKEILLYMQKNGRRLSLFNNDYKKNNKDNNISKVNVTINNKFFFSKNNTFSKNFNDNKTEINKIENKIYNIKEGLFINKIGQKPNVNRMEETILFKEEKKEFDENKEEDNNNTIEGAKSPVYKVKAINILFNSPSKTLKDEKIGINNINVVKHPVNMDKENDLSVCRLPNRGLKISSFKLILPIAKGGYGSVSLYKKISTGDFYAIKSVNINSMKEKNLSKTLKQE